MSEVDTTGTVVVFDGSEEFEGGEVIGFTPSRPSKAEAIVIGWTYYEADPETQDALLAKHDPILIRRSLQAFSNYAARNDQRDVAEYAALLRDEIKILRGEGEQAS